MLLGAFCVVVGETGGDAFAAESAAAFCAAIILFSYSSPEMRGKET